MNISPKCARSKSYQSPFIVDRIGMRNKTQDKRKIINDEYSYVATQVSHSSLIISLLSYVLLRMSIRSTMKEAFRARTLGGNVHS
jgi:hypothetical protein